ncbi:MAG TPA: helical backbone metal receptor [Vicinamibacterales bacterium]|nr:helical backbone metal receptor [Vicinamibacterales bacterium]
MGLGTRGWALGARSIGALAVALLLAVTPVARGLQPPGESMPQAPNPPSRIVSLVPSATEMLFAMGAGPRVAAVSSYDRFPPEVDRLPRVGALVDPDVERILSLRPDLVVAYASQTDLLAQLGRAGIPVYIYRHGSLADITAGMRALGNRIGMQADAERAAAGIERGLAEVRASAAGLPRPRTILVIGREPQSLRAISVSGGFGFLHDLLDLAGGDNVFSDVKRESMMVSTETILAKQPEVIVELHYTDSASRESAALERDAWKLLPGVPAVRNGRVRLLYGGELVVPGPRVVLTARAFARALR